MPEPMETLSGTIGTNSPDRVVPTTGIFHIDLGIKIPKFILSETVVE